MALIARARGAAVGGDTLSNGLLTKIESQEALSNVLENRRSALFSHGIYNFITTTERLKIFMEAHVWAVYDFMCLLKSLQIHLTSVSVPWLDKKYGEPARLINMIVLCEETDVDENGKARSHFDLYLEAMQEIGCDTSKIEFFIRYLSEGEHWSDAMAMANPPEYVRHFVSSTLTVCDRGSPVEIAAAFLHGREDPIPSMFKNFLESPDTSFRTAKKLRFYIERHIELDGDEHGPAAKKMLSLLVDDDPIQIDSMYMSAINAISARIDLWNGICDEFRGLDGPGEVRKKWTSKMA